MNRRQRRKRLAERSQVITASIAAWTDAHGALWRILGRGRLYVEPWEDRNRRRMSNKRIGGYAPWAARERRTRTDLRHLARRADRRRRRAIAGALAENRVPPGAYDLAGVILTRETTANEIWRRRADGLSLARSPGRARQRPR